MADAPNSIDQAADFHAASTQLTPAPPPDAADATAGMLIYNLGLAGLAVLAVVLFVRRGWHRLESPRAPASLWPLAMLGFFIAMFIAQVIGVNIAAPLIDGAVAQPAAAGSAGDAPAGIALDVAVLLKTGAYLAGLPVLVAAFWAKRRLDQEAPHRAAAPAKAALVGLGGLVLAWPVLSTVGLGARLLQEWITGETLGPIAHETLGQLLDPDGGAWRWAMIALVIVAAPLYEEVTYRGLLQEGLRHVLWSRWLAVGVAATIFTAMHATAVEPFALAALFVLGLGFGWVYERTGSIIAPIVMHAGFNAANVALALLLGPAPAA